MGLDECCFISKLYDNELFRLHIYIFIESWEKSKNITVSGSETSATVKSLRPSSRYLMRIFAENDIGIGASSDVITAKTKEEGELM